jgi:hypothetical protein
MESNSVTHTELNERSNERGGATFGEPDASLSLHGVNESVDRRGIQGIPPNQERLKRERLAYPHVRKILGRMAPQGAKSTELKKLRHHLEHRRYR